MSEQPGWSYLPIDLSPRNPAAKRALMLQPPGAAFCIEAKHTPSGRILYGYGATQDTAQTDAEQQARDWDERGS